VLTNIEFTCTPPQAQLRIAGELDLASHERLADAMWCLRAQGCLFVSVDLTGVTFIDASCLHLLDQERRRLQTIEGSLEVVAASERHQRVAHIAGYDELLAATRLDDPFEADLLRLNNTADPPAPTPHERPPLPRRSRPR
jgi:anti-anti-sigma factor